MADDALLPLPDEWERALVLVAHPDDIEFAGAAAVATWTAAGRHVAYALATRGEAGIDGVDPQEAAPLREAEQRAAARCVGVDAVEFLDFADGLLQEGLDLRRALAAAIRRHRPELVVTLNHRDQWGPGSWNTADHRALGRSVLDAAADAGNRWIFPELAVAGHEPWGGVRWVAVAGSPASSHGVAVAAAALDAATASFAAHRRYLEALSDVPPIDQARQWVTRTTGLLAPRFGGVPVVGFELISR